MHRFFVLSLCSLLFYSSACAKKRDYNYSVLHYDIDVRLDFTHQSIAGAVGFKLNRYQPSDSLLFDLDDPLIVDSVFCDQRKMKFTDMGDYIWVHSSVEEQYAHLKVYYHGSPHIAQNPPWDGGVIWTQDYAGWPWFSVACQGIGASLWWPCKDVDYEEPAEGVDVTVHTEKNLVAVSNGKLIRKGRRADERFWHYRVTQPINLYNVHISVGRYSFRKRSHRTPGFERFPIRYSLIRQMRSAKTKHLDKNVYPMLDCFQDWFGAYPFRADVYQIIETPFLGMEHQSGIAYGNDFRNGYQGRDLSLTGIGLLWDFIVVHESGHEWWGNSLTHKNIADMWLHESFTCYSETLFTECQYGRDSAFRYCRGEWENILNDKPIIGDYDQETMGSGDMYYKGAAMLHMIRMMMDDDTQFKNMLRMLQKKYYHRTVDGAAVEQDIIAYTGLPLEGFFDTYLRTIEIPHIEWDLQEHSLRYTVEDASPGFELRLKIYTDDIPQYISIKAPSGVIQMPQGTHNFRVDPNYLLR